MTVYVPPSRETIYKALFDLVCTAQLGGAPAFKTTGRALKSWDQVGIDEKPALYQFQVKETWMQNASGLPYVADALVELYLFAVQPDDLVVIAPQVNDMVDAVLATLKPTIPFGKQTLGGLVDQVVLRGEAEYRLGLAGLINAFAVIPIVLIMPQLQQGGG